MNDQERKTFRVELKQQLSYYARGSERYTRKGNPDSWLHDWLMLQLSPSL